ncbi:MAG: DUF11 domain-containing protein, partial [Saprospiraceae bacterium]|nr:DUF11 domain-containing protein [Saprospiraceae bacterium]
MKYGHTKITAVAFCFLLTLCTAPSWAQSPGGVNADIRLWFKSNAGVTQSGGQVSAWGDQSGNGKTAGQSSQIKQPGYTASNAYFNGYPSLDFDLTDDHLALDANIATRPYSFFLVFNSTTTSTAVRRAVQGSNNWLMGPYQNRAMFYAGAWVHQHADQLSTTPVLSAAVANTNAANNGFYFHNGKNMAPAGVTATDVPNWLHLGGGGAAPAERFGGSVAELIVYKKDMTAAERQRIESYLAVKYGITIDQTTPSHYVNSNGDVIWDHLFNGIYKNNIFAIGRDNGSALNQTQSKSANTDAISISNPSALSDGDFLFLSDNGLSTGPLAQLGLPGGAVAGSQRVWSVSKTGTVGTVDITIFSTEANPLLLVDNDNNGVFETALTPASSSGNYYTYSGLSLNNYAKLKLGYLTIAYPGGISAGLHLWLKAANAVVGEGTAQTWIDYGPGGYNASQSSPARRPAFTPSSQLFNRNPVLNFDLTDDGMATNAAITARPYTIFLLSNSTSTSTANRRAIQGSNNWLMGPYQNKAGFYAGAWVSNSITPGTSAAISTGTSSTNASANARFFYNGLSVTPAGVTATGVPGTLALGNAGSVNDRMGGSIGEVIAYTSLLSDADRNKVDSYLAVKYGITLSQATATNYTRSDGTIIWDATANGVYKNNIFGVGKDSVTCLNQTQSESVNTNRLRLDNPFSLGNGDFLLVSDNGLSAVPVSEGGLPGGATLATPLAYNVSITGTPGTIDITYTTDRPGSILLLDNDNNGTYEAAFDPVSVSLVGTSYIAVFTGISPNHSAKFKFGYRCALAESPNVLFTELVTPGTTVCSGTGAFVVRLTNISATALNNVVFRDSLPPGIRYVPGSVSGTGVSFGSMISENVVTFNIVTIPASGFVDVTFHIEANCAVSGDANTIKNTYQAIWDCGFTPPYVTQSYPILFPSLSITVNNGSGTVSCYTPFPREITICNGGFGSLDSVVVTDVQNMASLLVLNFNHGEVSGKWSTSGRTVLKAADFMTVGNMNGKLDQNECITIVDTLMATSGGTPIQSTITANWGCNGATCPNGTPNNERIVNTIIAAGGGGNSPQLTITNMIVPPPPGDSSATIYGHEKWYRQVIKNNSNFTAVDVRTTIGLNGLTVAMDTSFRVSQNGETPYQPFVQSNGTGGPYGFYAWGNNGGQVLEWYPGAFTGTGGRHNPLILLGDLLPGDSVVVTFMTKNIGPVKRHSNGYSLSEWFRGHYCSGFYTAAPGSHLSQPVQGDVSWNGCPSGTFRSCGAPFTTPIWNGRNWVANLPNANIRDGQLTIGQFRSFTFTDRTLDADPDRCAYFENDTIKIRLTADAMDLPFYTERSKFFIRITTNGGAKWDGKINEVIGRLTSWTNAPWVADWVEDRHDIDSTILVHFKIDNCPVPDFTTRNSYNSYIGGGFSLEIGLVNICPGPPVRRIRMNRNYQIDTLSNDPIMESGAFDFQNNHQWNAICLGDCADGPQYQHYGHERITFGDPDNNNDGVADVGGALNYDVIAKKLITWGDTLEMRHKLVIRNTQPGGVPHLYIRSHILHATTATAITANTITAKPNPQIVLRRPGVGVFEGTSATVPVDSANTFLANLSLMSTGGVSIPGIDRYQDGDTVEVVQHLVYWTPHSGWQPTTFNMFHVPFTSFVENPTRPDQIRCDSMVCNFSIVDMKFDASGANQSAAACAANNNMVFRINVGALTELATCGQTYFPGEVRNVLTPVKIKMLIPSATQWSFDNSGAVRFYWQPIIRGTGQCGNKINNQIVPAHLYSFSGDTVIFDVRGIVAHFGHDITVNNLHSRVLIDVPLKYNLLPSQTGCVKDHIRPSSNFTIWREMETTRPVDNTTLSNSAASIGPATINLPGANNNTLTMYAGTAVNVSSPKVIVPVRYNKVNSSVNGFDFIAVPDRPGITVDSIVDAVTNIKLVSVPGSAIYQIGYLGVNTNRDLRIYTTLNVCEPDTLFMYADRLPCSGYPASWADYPCKNYANSASYRYITSAGELQMVDSLFYVHKDICYDDTLQFRVINSQLADANTVRIGFVLPDAMNIVPGTAHLSLGGGAYVTVSDPVYSNGEFSWTLPPGDTLYNVTLSPLNEMILRVAVLTDCGYVSGSQITSSIAGRVGCGDIASLFNTNPPPLTIEGAPALNRLTNPVLTVQQATSCSPGELLNYNVALMMSGITPTGVNDSLRITLPVGYNYVSYNPAEAGSVNPPPNQPVVYTLPNGKQRVTFIAPAGINLGQSIIFTFKYQESSADNRCTQSDDRRTWIETLITSGIWCEPKMIICPVSIPNGADTAYLQQLKPNYVVNATATYEQGCANEGKYSYFNVTGTITNNGSAAVPNGTSIIMEVFVDINGNNLIDGGDITLSSLVYSAGLGIGSNTSFNYMDSVLVANCGSCMNKKILLRFSNTPANPLGSSQCMCESPLVTGIFPIVGAVQTKPDAGVDQVVSCAALPGGLANLAAFGTSGTWTERAGNPGTVTIASPNTANTQVHTFSLPGEYFFVWSDGSCTDTVKVTVTRRPDAGPDRAITCVPSFPGGSINMLGTGIGVWSAAAGNPGTATIANVNDPATLISNFSAAGTYRFVYTDGACRDTAMILVSDKILAGPNQTLSCITLPGGSVTTAASGEGTWTAYMNNPAPVTIADDTDPVTAISNFTLPGVYKFYWSMGACIDSMTITVAAKPDAGPDETLACVSLPGGTATMAASAGGVWSAHPGNPGAANITDPNDPATTITGFSVAGLFRFIYTTGTCKDTVAVTVTGKPNAGSDHIACVANLPGGSVVMNGVGLGTWTPGPLNPGTATIHFPNSQNTNITNFTHHGEYLFILTWGACADTAIVNVNNLPEGGPDQTVNCLPAFPGGTATMAASGTGAWLVAAGNPGTANITTPASPTTTITDFTAEGTYRFLWNDGACNDTVLVVVTDKPYAGPDQNVNCVPATGGTATMAAVGTGMWTAQVGNPTPAPVITTPGSATTTITGLRTAGNYNFIWMVNGCPDTVRLMVTAQPNAGVDKNLNCVAFPGGSIAMTATAISPSGMWSLHPDNPGVVTITNPASPTTTMTTFNAAGTYNFIWTNTTTNCSDTVAVVVTAKPNAGMDHTLTCLPTLPGGTVAMTASGTGSWSAHPANPGLAFIQFTNVSTTNITAFQAPGMYQFVWTDGPTGCTDTIAVNVSFIPNAGADRTACGGDLVNLQGTIYNNGTWSDHPDNPVGATLTPGSSGAATVQFVNTAVGVYYYIYTGDTCTDTMSITVTRKPDAGPDIPGLCGGSSATLTGTSPTTGTWTAEAGNPAGAT